MSCIVLSTAQVSEHSSKHSGVRGDRTGLFGRHLPVVACEKLGALIEICCVVFAGHLVRVDKEVVVARVRW